jgi:hypothetical protein
MRQQIFTFTLLALLTANPAFALDAVCNPIIKASTQKIAQAAWHSITESKNKKMEAMKVDGKFFMRIDGGKWQKGADFDNGDKVMVGMIQSGKAKVTNCKDEGSETLDGIATTVTSYTIEIAGMPVPATNIKLYTGKDDSLPYRELGESVIKNYRYKEVLAPTLQ